MISKLPFEIINIITSHLDQSDVYHLARTCKTLHSLSISRLYRSIILDSNKQNYSSEFNNEDLRELPSRFSGDSNEKVKCTIVRTYYGFKCLLKTLAQNSMYCGYIEMIEGCAHLPDLPEYELNEFFNIIFPRLTNLKVLKWSSVSTSLSLGLIKLLPNFEGMMTLEGNFKDYDVGHSITDSHYIPDNETSFSFLEELSLSNFNHSNNLKTIDLNRFPKLKSLKISKSIPTHIPINHGSSNNDAKVGGCYEIDYIENIFNKLDSKLQLRTLALDHILLKSHDADLLQSKIDLRCLDTLSILDCTECGTGTTYNNVSFLQRIHKDLVNLKELNIDLYYDFKDATPKFISTLAKLTKLYCVIRWNNNRSNLLHYSFENLLSMYLDGFSYQKERLTNLVLDFKFEEPALIAANNNHGAGTSKSIPSKLLKKLEVLTKLQTLRIPINESDFTDLVPILSHLPRLRILDLHLPSNNHLGTLLSPFNTNPRQTSLLGDFGECLHNGTLTTLVQSNNVFDNYQYDYTVRLSQYINYIRGFKKLVRELKYARIAKFVFKCEDIQKIDAMDGLDEWLDNQLGVCCG